MRQRFHLHRAAIIHQLCTFAKPGNFDALK